MSSRRKPQLNVREEFFPDEKVSVPSPFSPGRGYLYEENPGATTDKVFKRRINKARNSKNCRENKKKEVQALHAMLVEKDQLIAEKDQLIAEKDHLIAEKDQRFAELEAWVTHLQSCDNINPSFLDCIPDFLKLYGQLSPVTPTEDHNRSMDHSLSMEDPVSATNAFLQFPEQDVAMFPTDNTGESHRNPEPHDEEDATPLSPESVGGRFLEMPRGLDTATDDRLAANREVWSPLSMDEECSHSFYGSPITLLSDSDFCD